MPFEPGKSGNPLGRAQNVPNKATARAREAIAAFVEGNTERLNGLLDRIEEKDPKQAFDCIMAVCEYHLPKLARSESKTDANVTHRIVFGKDAE